MYLTRLLTPAVRRAISEHLASPLVLGSQAGITLVLGLSGPFETLALLSLPARLCYWGLLVFGIYAIGTAVTDTLNPQLRPTRLGYAGTAVVTGMINGLVAGGLLIIINDWLFSETTRALSSPAAVLGFTVLVALVVNGLHALAEYRDARSRKTPDARQAQLIDRLPPDRRGGLVALRVQDHYVEVITTEGQDMLLMRLRDAIREAAPEPGLQVHRSHWVAVAHVRSARLHGETATLVLSDGRHVPVSRTYLPAVTAAGLLRDAAAAAADENVA